MYRGLHGVVAALALTLPMSARAQPAHAPPHVTATARGERSIAIDGILDEAPWLEAEPAGDFVERVPHPGTQPTVPTTFRVVFDGDALYIGIEAGLAEGETPRGLTMTRDSDAIFEDDAISVKIDARLDHRTTLGFVVDASGAQLDYLALDNGRTVRQEVDMVWESASRVEGRTWTVELRIPVISLGLRESDGPRSIGLNVTRDHNARAATYDWSPMTPEMGPWSALHYGVVDGLVMGGGGAPVVVTPYAVSGLRIGDGASSEHQSIGGDLLARLGADVWGEATVLTDFAQVDLDDALVNLDRFPLFFPERRPFFLNGLDVFDAGVAETLLPFYSRRIGLDPSGRRLPILGGVKLYGREGPVTFGALDVLTDQSGETPASNVVAARARVAIEGASYVGLMVVSRQPFRWDGAPTGQGPHATIAVDGLLRAADDRLELYAFAAGTARDGQDEVTHASGEGFAGSATLRWRGQIWQPVLSALWVGREFDPELGFARRPGAARLALDSPVIARPSGFFRRMQIGPRGEIQVTDRFDSVLYESAGIYTSVEGEGGWGASYEASYVEDTVAQPFAPYRTLEVERGTYRGVILSALAYSPPARNPYFEVAYRVRNGFFGGTQQNPYARALVGFGSFVSLDVRADLYYVELPGVLPFWTYGLNALVRVTPTTNLQFDLLGRVNEETDLATAMLRMRWRYMPGSDVYFVWQMNAHYPSSASVLVEHAITLKLTYRFDFSV